MNKIYILNVVWLLSHVSTKLSYPNVVVHYATKFANSTCILEMSSPKPPQYIRIHKPYYTSQAG